MRLRAIHRIERRAAMEDFGNIAGACKARLLAAFYRASPDVRREDDVLLREKTGMNLRFVFGDIHAGAAEVSARQGLPQGILVHHGAARQVEQDGSALHERDGLFVEKVAGLGQQRHMKADYVGLRQQGFERAMARIVVSGGVMENNPHAEGLGPLGYGPADLPEADDPDGFAS